MPRLVPVAFDIETTGLGPDAAVTVAGLGSDVSAWLGLNTGGRPADDADLADALGDLSGLAVTVETRRDEAGLLAALTRTAADRLDGDRHYLCAFNGETWGGGFDLPVVRTACARHDLDWPFPAMAYADVRSMVDRFHTGDVGDLVGVAELLGCGDPDDPFDDSAAAVAAHERGHWSALLRHNLADLRRTHALAVLSGRFVAKSDYRMKNLEPPG